MKPKSNSTVSAHSVISDEGRKKLQKLFTQICKGIVQISSRGDNYNKFYLRTLFDYISMTFHTGFGVWVWECGWWVVCTYLNYVFSVRCRASDVPLLFIWCTSVVHLLSPCCSFNVLLFCPTSTSCTSLALFKIIHSSSAFHLRKLRRSQDALERHTPVPLLFLLALLTQ